MQEIKGDLFSYIGTADAICITTNGFVKSNGEAVMGKGCAKKATELWPGVAKFLGDSLKADGNTVIPLFSVNGTTVCSFPVKPVSESFDGTNAVRHMASKFNIGDRVPGWACKARTDIINVSAISLCRIADINHWKQIVLPRPGCGAGELCWSRIKPILDKHLDDRFYSITY